MAILTFPMLGVFLAFMYAMFSLWSFIGLYDYVDLLNTNGLGLMEGFFDVLDESGWIGSVLTFFLAVILINDSLIIFAGVCWSINWMTFGVLEKFLNWLVQDF